MSSKSLVTVLCSRPAVKYRDAADYTARSKQLLREYLQVYPRWLLVQHKDNIDPLSNKSAHNKLRQASEIFMPFLECMYDLVNVITGQGGGY